VLGGITYISQVVVIIAYVAFSYSLAIMFDKGITKMVERSCVDIQAAKRHSIFWFVYLSVMGGACAIIYNAANPYIDITWMQNYIQCMTNQNQLSQLTNVSYYHYLGPWGSFIKTGAVFMLLGAIFGTAKTFRDFKGVLWYDVDNKKKLKMVIFSNLCVIPSWVLLSLRFTVFNGYGQINMFLVNMVHLFILYFALFGLLPKYVFARWDLVKTASDYHYVPDYMEKEEGNVSL